MKSEWADYVAVQELCGNLSGNELTRSLSGNTRPQSSQLAEPLWIDSGIKSEISVRELISPLKRKKRRHGMNGRTFSPNPRKRGKSHHIAVCTISNIATGKLVTGKASGSMSDKTVKLKVTSEASV